MHCISLTGWAVLGSQAAGGGEEHRRISPTESKAETKNGSGHFNLEAVYCRLLLLLLLLLHSLWVRRCHVNSNFAPLSPPHAITYLAPRSL